jgi:hypothetical protein
LLDLDFAELVEINAEHLAVNFDALITLIALGRAKA